jgi:type II secretion system protein J
MKLVKGYSLIEMLIVLLIFSSIALISASFLSSSTNSFFQVNSKTEELKQLIIATEIIKEDLIHIVDKSTRNEFGIKKKSFLLSYDYKQSGKIIEFVRYSSNEGIGDSGSFQKIKYVLENGILKRYSSNFLNSPYLKDHTPLILNVSEVKIDNPLAFSSNSNDLNTIPIIINFKIKIKEVFFNKIFVVSNA